MDETRTATDKEARRRLAVQKVSDGWSQKDVADFLGVHPVTVNKWVRARRADPDGGRAGKPHPGRKPFLAPDQQRRVLGWLADKPTAHGFPTDLWTARRVAHLIREKLGVEYHPGYLREWLAKRGLSPQQPARRARERDLKAGGRWLKYGRLANFAPRGVNHLDDRVLEYLIELKCDPGLLRRLWDGSELPFPAHNIKQPRLPAGQ